MQIIRDLPSLQRTLSGWRRQDRRIALVPTMGNLHTGHLALVEAAVPMATHTLATIFVNPAQFVAGEDHEHYPRSEAGDCRKLEAAGADLVFIPDTDTVYPAGASKHTRVTVPGLDNILCGEYRPGHFTGVATVVAKLLNMIRPDMAFFGEKDYQQLLVIRRLVADLAFDVQIHAVPTVREADGLAMSSRNSYLTDTERALAPQLYELLCDIAEKLRGGCTDYRELETAAMSQLADAGWRPEYIAIRDAETLAKPGTGGGLAVLAAAWLGRARLIDNVRVYGGD
ncbi:MAG: pantoate--beta-alanine ligase [Gammaproteobacteria bacterium]|nr:pantoate--beta-alanine ligase [Gammaproteobacteria bacterium]